MSALLPRRGRRLDRPSNADPGAIDKLLKELAGTVERVQRTYSSQREYGWEQNARLLRSRVQAQRGEITRLHKKVLELRAEAHEWREKAEAVATERTEENDAQA